MQPHLLQRKKARTLRRHDSTGPPSAPQSEPRSPRNTPKARRIDGRSSNCSGSPCAALAAHECGPTRSDRLRWVRPARLGSLDHLEVPDAAVILNHHPGDLGGHYRGLGICTREPGNGVQRLPLRDDEKLDPRTEPAGQDRSADEAREFSERREGLRAKVSYVGFRLACPRQAAPVSRNHRELLLGAISVLT